MIRQGDGPCLDLPEGGAECCECGLRFITDIYYYQGRLFCGDCRYHKRTGRWPPPSKPRWGISDPHPEAESFRGSETLGRMLEFECESPYHAIFLDQWITLCQLSLQ